MKIDNELSDETLVQEIGRRLAQKRVDADLTQAELAEQAGVSKRTLERLESGTVASQLSVFLRVCRALGILEQLELFLPEAQPGPMAQLRSQGRKRRRASGKQGSGTGAWTWGEPS